MLKIYIARHGQDEDNLAGILNGHRDTPLTEKGVSQAHDIAERIKELGIAFEAVYTSPLQRAFETGKIIAETAHAPAPEKEQLLIEREFGVMTGKKIADVEKLCAPNIIKAEIITYFLEPEGAETFPQLMARGRKLLDKLSTRHTNGNVLLVAHGDIGKLLYAEYYHVAWKQVLTQFHFGNGELLLMSEDSPASEAHVFKTIQFNR